MDFLFLPSSPLVRTSAKKTTHCQVPPIISSKRRTEMMTTISILVNLWNHLDLTGSRIHHRLLDLMMRVQKREFGNISSDIIVPWAGTLRRLIALSLIFHLFSSSPFDYRGIKYATIWPVSLIHMGLVAGRLAGSPWYSDPSLLPRWEIRCHGLRHPLCYLIGSRGRKFLLDTTFIDFCMWKIVIDFTDGSEEHACDYIISRELASSRTWLVLPR